MKNNRNCPLSLELYNATRTRIPARLFLDLLAPAHAALVRDRRISPKQTFSLELSLVGDAMIQKLNRIHHKKDRPTDVVSLSYFENELKNRRPLFHKNFLAGEIFISLPYARKQARAIGQSLNEELRFLFVHGLLHSFGYDHMKPKEEEHMLTLSYAILGRA